MSAIQGSGLEGCLQFRDLDYRGVPATHTGVWPPDQKCVCNSGVWTREGPLCTSPFEATQ